VVAPEDDSGVTSRFPKPIGNKANRKANYTNRCSLGPFMMDNQRLS